MQMQPSEPCDFKTQRFYESTSTSFRDLIRQDQLECCPMTCSLLRYSNQSYSPLVSVQRLLEIRTTEKE